MSLSLYWEHSQVSTFVSLFTGIQYNGCVTRNSQHSNLSHELRGFLVIHITGAGELGLYNYWRWLLYLSFRLWLLDISRSDLRSIGKGISTVLCWWRWRDDIKFLGFRVQIVVRYHGHHITNTWCHPNTRIPIGYLLGLFIF